ncbi:hypothetical protein [Crateriforma conspicua]|nr:hypothetical protein [Crateriforma conspicua]
MIAVEGVLQHSSTFFVQYASLTNYYIGFVALAGAISLLVKEGYGRKVLPTQLLLYTLLLVLAAVSTQWSPDTKSSIAILKSSVPFIVTFVFVAPFCSSNDKHFNTAVEFSVFYGGVVIVGMLLCEFGQRGITIGYRGGRTVESNPLAIASYAGVVCICCLFSIYSHKKTKWLLWLKIGIAALAVLTIFKSGSRGQLFALAVALLLWLPLTVKFAVNRSAITAIVIIAFIGFLGGIFFVDQNPNRWRLSGIQSAQRGRIDMALDAINVYADGDLFNWILGVGSSASYKIFGIYPHNVPVEILLEEGLAGLFLFIPIAFVSGRQGYRILADRSISFQSRVNIGVLMALFTFFGLLMFKQGSMLGSTPFFGTAVCIGWIAQLHSPGKQP